MKRPFPARKPDKNNYSKEFNFTTTWNNRMHSSTSTHLHSTRYSSPNYIIPNNKIQKQENFRASQR